MAKLPNKRPLDVNIGKTISPAELRPYEGANLCQA